MPSSPNIALSQAEQYLFEGKFNQSLRIVEDLEKRNDLILVDQLTCSFLKSRLLNNLGRLEEASRLAQQAYQKSQELGSPELIVDGIIILVENLRRSGKFDEALDLISQGEQALRFLAQTQSSDSTQKEAQLLYHKGAIYSAKGNFDEALNYGQRGLTLFKALNDKLAVGNSFNVIGTVYQRKGDLDQALEYFEQALTLHRNLNNSLTTATSLNNIGAICQQKGDFNQALEYFKRALTLREALGNKQDIAGSLNNIGVVYWNKGDLDRALEYFQQSLTLKKSLGNKQDIAKSLNNVGLVHAKRGELDQALGYYDECLKIDKELGNKKDIATSFNNIGTIYRLKGDSDQALEYFQQSLTLRKEIGNNREIATTLHNIGTIFGMKGDLNKALDYYQQGLPLFKTLGHKQAISLSLHHIASTFRQKGDLGQALECFQESLTLREEIGNKQDIAISLNSIGILYWNKGKLNRALDYFQQSLALHKEIGNNIHVSETIFSLICVILDKKSLEETEIGREKNYFEQALTYLNQLQMIHQSEKNKIIYQQYNLARALVLKASEEEKMAKEAQEIFQQTIQEDIISYEITIFARLNLCHILFERFILTGERGVLDDLRSQLKVILDLAEQGQLKAVVLAILILQGKLDLIQFNIDNAQSLFQKVKKETHEKGYEALERQCDKELRKVEEYATMDFILNMAEAEKENFRKKQTEEIVNYLREVALQLQGT